MILILKSANGGKKIAGGTIERGKVKRQKEKERENMKCSSVRAFLLRSWLKSFLFFASGVFPPVCALA